MLNYNTIQYLDYTTIIVFHVSRNLTAARWVIPRRTGRRSDLGPFDGVFYDTYAEHYTDMQVHKSPTPMWQWQWH